MTNKEYVKLRVSCIPEGLKYADEVAGAKPKDKAERKAWTAKWDYLFLHKVDELVKDRLAILEKRYKEGRYMFTTA